MLNPRIPSYLSKSRHGIYYVRFATPTALMRACPNLPREIRKSLNTRDLREAAVRSRKLVLDFRLSMAQAPAAMKPEDDKYSGQFYVDFKSDGSYRFQFEKGDTAEEVEQYIRMLQAIGRLPANATVVDTMGINPTPQEKLEVKMEFQSQKAGGMWLSELITSFAEYKHQSGEWGRDSTWTQTYRPLLRDFREIVSKTKRKIIKEDGVEESIWDIQALDLEELHIQTYTDAMWRFPKSVGSMKGIADAKQALNSGLEPQSSDNAFKKLRMVRTFLMWAYKRRKLSEQLDNLLPTERKRKMRDKSKDGYQPWTDAELKKIFERDTYPSEETLHKRPSCSAI